jgi:AcrR family transcriptional regulator
MTLRDETISAVPAISKPRGAKERREHLAAMAGKLIAERGFESLSVNVFAEDVGMSVGGMYRYIKTKSDLLVMACEGIYGNLRDRIVHIAAGERNVLNKLRHAMQAYFDACGTNQDLILLMYREYRHLPKDTQRRYQEREEAIAEVFAGLIRSGMRRGAFRAVNAAVIGRDIVLLGHMPALKGWSLRGHIDPVQLTREQIDLVLGRLAPAEKRRPATKAILLRKPKRK